MQSKKSWKLKNTYKQNCRARLKTAARLAQLADKKAMDLVFPVFVYRSLMHALR